jgi:hypothetical protein
MINNTLDILYNYSFIFYGLMYRFLTTATICYRLYDIFLIYDDDVMMLNVMMLKYYTVYYIDDETI